MTAAIAASGLLAACSSFFDAYIANPCDRPVEVETFEVPAAKAVDSEPAASTKVPPLAVKFVEAAFTDGAGYSWSIALTVESSSRLTGTNGFRTPS